MNETNILPIQTLLPLRALTISLRFIDFSRPRFFHQAALTAFIRHLLDNPQNYANLLTTDCAESGRVGYTRGDHYQFTVIGLSGSESLLALLIERLKELPESALHSGPVMPFSDNWRLVALHDALTRQPVNTLDDLSLYDYAHLVEESNLWAPQTHIHWQWLSPVRLLKDKAHRQDSDKDEKRFCRHFEDISSDLLFSRLYDAIASLLRQRGEMVASRYILPTLSVDKCHLFWIDSRYSDRNGRDKPQGGMLGYLQMQNKAALSEDWWRMLVLGQYLGIGQCRVFGLGRYKLVTEKGECSTLRTSAAFPLMMSVVNRDNLLAAYQSVSTNDNRMRQVLSGVEENPWKRLHEIKAELLEGHYRVPALNNPVLSLPAITKRGCGYAIPPFWDTVVQSAVERVIRASLHALMPERVKRMKCEQTRIHRPDFIRTIWQRGYRWAYAVRFEHFFASINLQWLFDRLISLFGEDPLIAQIMNWLSAPVDIGGIRHPSPGGLPRGSPLSTLFGELLISEIREILKSQGLKLVYHRKGLFVMCKSPGNVTIMSSSFKNNGASECVLNNYDWLEWLVTKDPIYFSRADELMKSLSDRVEEQK